MLKVFTAFSGYDSQCLALNRIGIEYELVGWSEIDKHAIKAHNALFPQWRERNFGDITQIDWSKVPDFDLFTYSSPCQDFSNAGLMRGGEKGSGTRSSLLWECEKAIRAKLPTYLLMENVAALVNKRFISTFNQWLDVLSSLGYTNYWKVLNAKDYGVLQNRKRVFVVSILNSQEPYYFPEPIETNLRLKDVLEGYVDEKYYLSNKYLEKFYKTGKVWKGMSGTVGNIEQLSPTITTNKGEGQKIAIPQQLELRTDGWREPVVLGWTRDSKGNIVNRHPVEISNTITSSKRDNTQNYVVQPTTIQRGHGYNQGKEFKDFIPTITGSAWHFNNVLKLGYRIRKYTERECFRLMGVNDTDSDKIREVVSKSQCYKLAGNSIVVDVLAAIFQQLFTENKTTDRQLKLF
jgi:DNA (cytosine-5)-methyltransferase 1